MPTNATKSPAKVYLKPTLGTVRTGISAAPSDRRALGIITRAYEAEKGISPSHALVYSIALNLLASEVRRGHLPSHPDLRPCHP